MASKTTEYVYLRSYPKVIFFWPLIFTSLILWIIELFIVPSNILGYIWFIVFFTNLFVIAFDFSTTKFFVLVLSIVLIILLIVFLVLPNIQLPGTGISINLTLPADFYLLVTLILAIILGIVILGNYFDYWKIERNEIYHKKGIFASAERFPTANLRIRKEIPDVFEFFILRSGSITLIPGKGDSIHLNTVLNINKKVEAIDHLLSYVSVEPDELDE
ncbi:MAG: hypothetical protein ACTSXH_19725 [Promethearchaeota archaeon]